MARQQFSALKAKIEKEISKLQKRKEALDTKQRKPVIANIVNTMRQYDITPTEVTAAFGSPKQRGRRPSAPKAASTSVKRPVAPKYRHPTSGETWSGRGKAPRWLVAAEASDSARDSFLIKT
jgi:DNA-binding protein H-NS